MLRSTWWLLVALILSMLAVRVSPAHADKAAAPFNYARFSPDGQLLFVMLAPSGLDNWRQHLMVRTTAGAYEDRPNIYQRSGLYRNDGSTEPLWTVDWYAFDVDVASDGVHLIRHGPWASSTDEEALSFFANGALLRSYRIRDLVHRDSMLEQTVSHFFWRKQGSFDDPALRYSLTTMDLNRYIFDANTGAIVSQSRSVQTTLTALKVVLVLALAAMLGLVVWSLVRRRRRARARLAGT